ncbi:phage tail protein [Photorhabdus kleinii]|uniref:phage tail protein n=1 Tax=Photorhabdus kleinii TaxID=768034 RepID=UPI0021D495C5|nr:phage tail protein [Photorhabdus kleinii]MCT8343800.1 phage tail protein [Photorhabdus kleinii]
MEKKPNLSNAESNMENIKSNGPSADNLKKRFKEGSIPLQTDYADLINIADMGRRAVGKAPDQTDNPNSALVLNNNSGLAVKVNSSGGLQADNNGVSVKIKNKSLLADNSGLAVNTGRGLRINNDKLEVDNHYGIEIVNEGIKVKAGEGIKVDSNGVSLNIGETKNSRYSSLRLRNNVFSVELNDGLIDRSGGITIGQGDGIIVGNQTVSVKAGNGITVNSNGVSIDPNKVLPRGMIVMFSGDSAPPGWAFCDGTQGTPDLRSRFVMCGNNFSDKGNSDKANGSGNGKNFFKDTTSKTISVSVTVEDTILEESHIPSHKHIGGMPYNQNRGIKYNYASFSQTSYQINNRENSSIWCYPSTGEDYHPYTSNTGGGKGHDHPATASSSSHNHSVDVIPPYYLLAFIMKL